MTNGKELVKMTRMVLQRYVNEDPSWYLLKCLSYLIQSCLKFLWKYSFVHWVTSSTILGVEHTLQNYFKERC